MEKTVLMRTYGNSNSCNNIEFLNENHEKI